MNARGTFVGCLVAALVAASSGCGDPPEEEFDGKTLAVGETFVEGYDPTADRPIRVYLPSGVLNLRLEEQTAYLDDGSKYTSTDIAAAEGAELIGIEWELEDISPYPTDVSEALMATYINDLRDQTMSSGLGTVKLSVVTDGHHTQLPAGDEVTDKSRHAVVGVPKGSSPTLEVEYDGETQVVDLVTGKVDAGRAEPLAALQGNLPFGKDSWQLSERVECEGKGGSKWLELNFHCRSSQALELPYVRGLGWAEKGTPYVLAEVYRSTAPLDKHRKNVDRLVVTLDGAKPVKTIDYGWGAISVFRARTSPQHEVRIQGSLDPKDPDLTVDQDLVIETWRLP